jgi:RNA polymerase sigma factor (sigma-70 family)
MTQLSDELLIEFSQGSPRAFQAIFDSFRMRIFYFVRKLIDDGLAAEEITSDTFIKLHRLHDKFNTYNNIQAFLFITARNACLDFLKHRQRMQQHKQVLENLARQEEGVPLFAESDIEAEVLAFIYKEVERLPTRSKMVFKLFYFEGRTVGEIAKIMKISPQTVANTKLSAVKLLRMKVLDRPGLLLWLLYFLGETWY